MVKPRLAAIRKSLRTGEDICLACFWMLSVMGPLSAGGDFSPELAVPFIAEHNGNGRCRGRCYELSHSNWRAPYWADTVGAGEPTSWLSSGACRD